MERVTIDFGIDLGTTNSTISVIDGTDAKTIPNKGGSAITPSAIWIDKRGNMHVGQEAKERALVNDKANGELEFKLRMGGGKETEKHFVRSNTRMSPEAMSAEVLKSLKADVQTNMGENLRAAVITVPAAFELPQTDATQRAAKLAGFAQSPLLLEPVAASLAYGFQSESENAYWLVYDFGGGTFDAAVMRVRDGLIQVVNHDGDNNLGGKLIDWDIVTKKLVPAILKDHKMQNFNRGELKWERAFGKMKWSAEQAKIEVCRTKEPVEIYIEDLCEDNKGNSIDLVYNLTPEDIAEISRPYIVKTLGLCKKTLEYKGLSSNDMERILMVGGTTLNPWVREAVQNELGSQVEYGIDPITVVARGAAIFASTQALQEDPNAKISKDTYKIQIEHEPVGNVKDPEVMGKVMAPDNGSLQGFTIEFVDSNTNWRSGKITLGDQGFFQTQLFAEEKRRCDFNIQLCDPTGTQLKTSPGHVVYTIGVVPDNPPAPNSIGIALADGTIRSYVKKGDKLPVRVTRSHRTISTIKAGDPDAAVKLPVLEGENPKAGRNHGIGDFLIQASKFSRDLPAGSEVEVTLVMETDLSINVNAFIPVLDEEYDMVFDTKNVYKSIDELEESIKKQKERLNKVKEDNRQHNSTGADSAIKKIEEEELLDQAEEQLKAAKNNPDEVKDLDRNLCNIASVIDKAEDSVEFPKLVQETEETKSLAESVVNDYGDASDKKRFVDLKNELQQAIDKGDLDMVRKCNDNMYGLAYIVYERQPGFHLARFNSLVEVKHEMNNQTQADQLIAQGRRAINNNDISSLKATNRQLETLLPDVVREQSLSGLTM